jgi:hypothetical protein
VKDFPSKCSPKQVGVAIVISNKADFKPRFVRRDREGYFISIKGIIHQEDITMVTYSLNVSTSSFIKQTLLDIKTQIYQHNNSG